MKLLMTIILLPFLAQAALAGSTRVEDNCVTAYYKFSTAAPIKAVTISDRIVKSTVAKTTKSEAGSQNKFVRAFQVQFDNYYGKVDGLVVSACDDGDMGQANCMEYFYKISIIDGKEKSALVAIKDLPHCCGPTEVEFICENPYAN